MSKLFKSSIISSISLIILGLLLFFQAETTIISISYIIGAILIAIGVLSGLKFVGGLNNNNINELDVIYGIVCVVLGILIITNPTAIASAIPIVVGVIIVLNSVIKLHYSLELKENKNDLWKSTMIMSVIMTVCGIVLIFNPFAGAVFITKIIGALIVIYAVLDIASTIVIKNNITKLHNAIEEKIVDADVVEDKTNNEEVKKKKRKELEHKKDITEEEKKEGEEDNE